MDDMRRPSVHVDLPRAAEPNFLLVEECLERKLVHFRQKFSLPLIWFMKYSWEMGWPSLNHACIHVSLHPLYHDFHLAFKANETNSSPDEQPEKKPLERSGQLLICVLWENYRSAWFQETDERIDGLGFSLWDSPYPNESFLKVEGVRVCNCSINSK